MKKIAVVGAGGFGREVKMLIDQINEKQPTYEFVGYFDDGVAKGTLVGTHPVLGTMDDLAQERDLGVVLAVGNPPTKEKILRRIQNEDLSYPVLIHPSVYIGKDDVEIGEGTIICAGCILTVGLKIGAHVILNLACTVGHDTTIEDYASFMPGVNISGEVHIGEKAYIGTGAKIINQVEIGAGTIVGAGAVVSKTLPANCTAVGIPAKPIKFHS